VQKRSDTVTSTENSFYEPRFSPDKSTRTQHHRRHGPHGDVLLPVSEAGGVVDGRARQQIACVAIA
jgi:hypothetical protein